MKESRSPFLVFRFSFETRKKKKRKKQGPEARSQKTKKKQHKMNDPHPSISTGGTHDAVVEREMHAVLQRAHARDCDRDDAHGDEGRPETHTGT
jgi:hypothetical protein